MEIREIKPINFLFHREVLKMSELERMIPISQALYVEAVRLNLRITGPIHWHYFGITTKDAPFTLEVSLPVAEVLQGYDGAYHFKRTDNFKAVTHRHEGSFDEFEKTYEKVFGFITEKKLVPNGMCREVYINVDFANPSANIAEVQIGIQ
ncbi:MAG TPA: GyrI-like domain-containing protein [Cyclobacteriaceae bacterium]|nr:GyrI-like domain-containing protein [Cyclobacteriaceae bacterium]